MRSYKFFAKLAAALFMLSAVLHCTDVRAEETPEAAAVDIRITSSSGKNCSSLLDPSYDSYVSFDAGETITITGNEPFYGLYIIWGAPSDPWTFGYNGKTVESGTHGFLHEYLPVDGGTASCTISLEKSERICSITAYSAGALPDSVQVWEPSCQNADLLVFSTHADDEILFMGGVLATYGGSQGLAVQVVYMTQYWDGLRIREHEKLDGLWASGIKHYPVNGSFSDLYAETLEQANSIYNYDEVVSFVTEQVRRFKPLICVTQDLNGEYGHGGHQLLAHAVCDAADSSADSSFCSDSASAFGTWDIPKTYLHLYPENKITMDLRLPLEKMGGQTALDIAAAAYKQHVSQQWCWFYVSDDYEYSCADFGLYRTTVGADTEGNSMLEHIVTYEEQERIAQQKASEEASRAEASRQAEEASVSQAIASSQAAAAQETQQAEAARRKMLLPVLLCIAAAAAICLLLLSRRKRKTR